MKKILLLLFALLGLALQGMAQTVIEFPQYTKILKVVSKGINVREEPSTQSAKLGNSPDMLLVVDEDAEWYHACIIKNGKICHNKALKNSGGGIRVDGSLELINGKGFVIE